MKRNATIEDLKLVVDINPPKKKRTMTSHLSDENIAENQQTLELCRQYYDNLSTFRDVRRRAVNYYKGDQWSDAIEDEDGNVITEEEYIRKSGKIPFKQNIIRQLVRSLLGQYRTNTFKIRVNAVNEEDSDKADMLTNALQTVKRINNTRELDTRNFEEFIISGMAVGYSKYTYIPRFGKEDVKFDNENPSLVFFNTDLKDPRLFDLRIIGRLIDTTIDDVITSYARSEKDEEKIRGWYTDVNPKNIVLSLNGLTTERMENIDFYIPSDTNKVRIIEVWELSSEWRTYAHDYLDGTLVITKLTPKEIDEINAGRIKLAAENNIPAENVKLIDATRVKTQFWTIKMLTPYGQCLFKSETPYKHGETPFDMVLYPMVDGAVWGLVTDLIDQNRYINRLVSLYDFIMGSSAKGVLLMPEEAIPDDMDISDITDKWSDYNGVIKFKSANLQHLPQQVSTNATNIGITELLQLQMKFIQDISGVNEAMQGQQPKAGTPASMYAQQAVMSANNSKDLFESFKNYERSRDVKLLKLIQQFYTDKRYIGISGERSEDSVKYYDPDAVKDTQFELAMSEVPDTPVFRYAMDDTLQMLLKNQLIDMETYLKHSSLPFADALLEDIKASKEKVEQGGKPQFSPENVQAVQQQSNPQFNKIMDKLGAGNVAQQEQQPANG